MKRAGCTGRPTLLTSESAEPLRGQRPGRVRWGDFPAVTWPPCPPPRSESVDRSGVLKHIPYPGTSPLRGLNEDADPPLAGLGQAEQQVEQCRIPTAVATDQTDQIQG